MFLVMVHYQGTYNQLLFEKVDCYCFSKFIYVLYCSARVPTAYSNRTKWKCCTAANGYSNSNWAGLGFFKIEIFFYLKVRMLTENNCHGDKTLSSQRKETQLE